MTRPSYRYLKGIQRAAWSVIWVLLLSGPIVYYRLPRPLGVGLALFTALLPLVLTVGYSVLQALRKRRPIAIVKVPGSTAIRLLLLVTFLCIYTEPDPATWVVALVNKSILWGVTGVVVGIIWSQGQGVKAFRERNGSTAFLMLAAFLLISLVQSWRGVAHFGAPGVIIGPIMTGGLFLGFLLGFSTSRLWKHLRDLWKDMVIYRWDFATFIVGYVLIVYIFAGLFAILWRLDMNSLGSPLDRSANFSDFLFYSLTTASTLGSVDSKPTTLPAKFLTSAEVLAGVFWVTVVFAQVSARTQEHRKLRSRNSVARKNATH